MNDKSKTLLLWVLIPIILISVFSNFGPQQTEKNKLTYTQFIQAVSQGEVSKVTISNKSVTGSTKNGQAFSTYLPMQDDHLLNELINKDVDVVGKEPEKQSFLLQMLINWFPMILLIGVWLWFMRQMQGGGSGKNPMSFGKSRAKMLVGDQNKVTFKDVAGITEAKEEVQELVDFLRDPAKFQKLGGKIPCGALLVGNPGTGKTLLAKAVAGEADVPFFSISGSDFVEMFVGVGASRVRDMFEQAKKQSPCIIFIDEIDAVGRHRGAGHGGGNDEREQTLNQLLVEMDGFGGKEGIIVMAATTRPDVLDPALLRPGRFDRQVTVPLPDINGRDQILNVHIRNIPTAKDVVTKDIARGTPGFSGADLANLANEAALFAARSNKRKVSMVEFEKAKDKIIMGAERSSMVMSEDEKLRTAYHESGHAIIGRLLMTEEHDPVYKVSIIPRGRALGVTMFLPEEDKYSVTVTALHSQICSLYGGRIAEEMIFGKGKVTTGASNDIERASSIAKNMVVRWGLDEELGPILYTHNEQDEGFAAKPISMSANTANKIDAAIARIIDINYKKAEKILKDNIDKMHAMSEALMKFETIDETQITDIMEGKEPKKTSPKSKSGSTSSKATKDGTKTAKKPNNDTELSDDSPDNITNINKESDEQK
ncbi:MAG: ATP-dependent zinc metalloprotease FtsH [Legionellales bacterium]|nr:ATP-dependent zinc metalloprotease FtsH [Legionellales bacterium]